MKRLALGLLLSAVLIGLLWGLSGLSAQTAKEGVGEAFASLSAGGLALAALCYGASYVGRALRLAVLLPGPDPLWRLVSICARHNLFNLVLPMRSGEASLPLMLRTETGRSLAQGAAALVVARVLDLLSVALYLSAGLALTAGAEARGTEVGADLGPRVAGIVALLVASLLLMRPLAGWLARRCGARADGSSPAGTAAPGIAARVTRFVGQTATHLADQPLGRLSAALLVSLLTWGLTYGACFALVADMAGGLGPVGAALAPVTFVQSLVASTFLHLTGILPINTPAGVGVWEAGWAAGYMFIGVGRTAAIASAVVSHAAIFAMITGLGGLGWLAARRRAR